MKIVNNIDSMSGYWYVVTMGITQRDKDAFYLAHAVDDLVEALELDREDGANFRNKTKSMSIGFIKQLHDALTALDPNAAECARIYYAYDCAVYLSTDHTQFTEEFLLSPFSLFPILGKYLSGRETILTPEFVYSAIRRSSRIRDKCDSVRDIVARGAMVQSCITRSYIDWERDDTQCDDDVLIERIAWFADNAEALAPLTGVLRERVVDGLLDFDLCREMLSNTRTGASLTLMEGAL